MEQLKLIAKEFKRMLDPVCPRSKRIKYVCYVQANSIPNEITDWMATNPREQDMTTNVATRIKNSLSDNENFHELNKGILISAKSVNWDNKTDELLIEFDDPEIHGNIDGGHTLKAIIDEKMNNSLSDERYVFFEIIEGVDSPVELAAARNTSVPVDLKSLEELEKNFDVLKEILSEQTFFNRIQFKMNEHYNDGVKPLIDVREIIAIIIMFSQEIYPYKGKNGILSDIQPIQSYSGKEASLIMFINQNSKTNEEKKKKREKMLRNMRDIIPDIFALWEKVETSFAVLSDDTMKIYRTRKYSRYNHGETVAKSLFEQTDLQYIVPRGLMYPVVGAFRALVQQDKSGKHYWRKNPIDMWAEIGTRLVNIVLDERTENPEVIAKSSSLWSNLFKEVYIYGYLIDSATTNG